MAYNSLVNYYQTIHQMMNDRTHKYSISDLEQIYPFERDLYVDLLVKDRNENSTIEAPE